MKTHRNIAVSCATTAWLCATIAISASAASSTLYTATGDVTGVPYNGVWLTNTVGQIFCHGNVQVLKMISTEPRLNGRRIVLTEGVMATDGSAVMSGAAYQEVGTWDVSDPANPKFAPTVGYWNITWKGTMNADGSTTSQELGCGVGKSIDGMRFQETKVRPPGAWFDPTIPYRYTGTLSPGPATTLISDDFAVADNPPKDVRSRVPNAANYTFANGLCTITAQYPEPSGFNNTGSWLRYRTSLGQLADGKTVTIQVELVYAAGPDLALQLMCWAGDGLYGVGAGPNYVGLAKISDDRISFFFAEHPRITPTNVVLSLSFLSRSNDLYLTTQIVDKGPSHAVLFEKTVLDTPASDPCLTGSVEVFPGAYMSSSADPAGNPWTSLDMPVFGIMQITDGKKAAVTAVFDNFLATKIDPPSLAIQKSILLSWPASSLSAGAESALSVSGPWRRVTEPIMECNGNKQVTIPVLFFEPMGIYRLK